MIAITDDYILYAITGVCGYFVYLQKYLMSKMSNVVEQNTKAVNTLTGIVLNCTRR